MIKKRPRLKKRRPRRSGIEEMAQIVRDQFARRLNVILDEENFPRKYIGRQVQLGELCEVSQKGARLWLEGGATPSLRNLLFVAKKLNTTPEWLLFGASRKTRD